MWTTCNPATGLMGKASLRYTNRLSVTPTSVAVLGPKDSLTQRVRGAIRADIGIVQPQIIYVLLQLLRSTV